MQYTGTTSGGRRSRQSRLYRQCGLSVVSADWQCVRLFEEGIRLNPTDTSQTSSAFVLFNADQTQAELHLPSGELLALTRQGVEGNWSWQGSGYTLFIWKGYVLKSGDKALYHGE